MALPLYISLITWNYLLFVQFWPVTWIQNESITNANFTNDHFNIHGIWPQYYNGSYPQFCNNNTVFNTSVLGPIMDNLTIYWTDYVNASAFWQHEFMKHGTCAASDPLLASENVFFETALALRNRYDIYKYLAENRIYPANDITYKTEYIRDTIRDRVGKKIAITCSNNKLDEIILCMDKDLNLIDCPDNITNCQITDIVYGKL